MPNGQTSLVDTLSKLIIQVGFPTVMAGVLLWWLLTTFQSNMNAIVTRMANNTDVIAKLIANEEGTYKELQAQTVLLKSLTGNSERLLQIQEERQRVMVKGER